jgi:hypothetical protein
MRMPYWTWGWIARGPKFWSFGIGLWSLWGPCNYWEYHFPGERWINISWNND